MSTKRIISIICIMIAALLIFAGCGKEAGKPDAGSADGGSVAEQSGEQGGESGGEPQNGEETQSSAERPTAGGNLQEIYDLSVEWPSFMTANSYNGMLGVYNFYTNAGTDLNICASGLGDDFEINAYIAKSVLASNSGVGELKDVVINGRTWRASDNGKKLYMAAANADGVYEVVLTRGASEDEYKKMYEMVMATLWLA